MKKKDNMITCSFELNTRDIIEIIGDGLFRMKAANLDEEGKECTIILSHRQWTSLQEEFFENKALYHGGAGYETTYAQCIVADGENAVDNEYVATEVMTEMEHG